MKQYISLILTLPLWINAVFAQIKSDLDVLLPYVKNSVTGATKFGEPYCSGFLICYRVLRYNSADGKTKFAIELKNESKSKLSFRYCVSVNEDGYKNISNWRPRVYLNPNEIKITGLDAPHLTSSIWVSVGAVEKGNNASVYEYERKNSDENDITICAFCSINENDNKCPKGEIDETVYQDLLMEGDEYSETELGKIKGTTPLTEGEKKNAKIDAAAQGINLLFKLGRDIKQAKAEKKEKLQKEQIEVSKQNEENRKAAADFEKSSYSLIQSIGRPMQKFKNYFSNLGYTYRYHEGIDNSDEDIFELFYIDHFSDRADFVFPKGKEKYLAPLLKQLVELREYITFYVADNTINANGFSITKIKGHTTQGHGTAVEEDYNYILKVAEKAWGTNTDVTSITANINYTSGSESNFNLGKIENGQNHTHAFQLSKNVKSATASCGCVTVDINNKEPKVVSATFHGIGNYSGPFAKSITVVYEDGATEVLYLKGEIK